MYSNNLIVEKTCSCAHQIAFFFSGFSKALHSGEGDVTLIAQDLHDLPGFSK